jgi:hypothetical protein
VRRLLVDLPLQDPAVDQRAQAGGQPVARRAGVARDLREAPVAERHLADDQQRPPVADQFEGGGQRAGPAREGRGVDAFHHVFIVPRHGLLFKPTRPRLPL